MDDPPDAPGGTAEEAPPARPTPVSARDVSPPPAARRKPTPARAMVDADAVAQTGPDETVEEVRFRVDDAPVIAAALGRSGRSGSTPLLLIGFWHGGDEGDGDGEGGEDDQGAPVAGTEHVRETLVVARALSDLGEDALRAAWHGGREPPAPPGAPPRRNEQRRRR